MKLERTGNVVPPSYLPGGDAPRAGSNALHPRGDERFLWESLLPRLIHPVQLAIIEALRKAGGPLSEDGLFDLLEVDGSGREPLTHHLRCMVRVGVLAVVDDQQPPHGAGDAKCCYAFAPVGCSSSEEPITIAADQRNALYHLLLSDLSAYSNLQAAYARGDLEECYRLGRRMTDCMRLIQDGGLGWGDETAERVVQLTLPGEELRRILIAQRDLLITHREATRPEREEIETEMGLDAVALSGCEDALTQMHAR